MFRDFIYLDTSRVQSIISQLHEGLLTQVISGESELSGSAKAGIISSLIGLEIGGKRSSNINESKILHDYSFNVALESLRENNLLLDASCF